MKHQEEQELRDLRHRFVTVGIDGDQQKRMNQLVAKKGSEINDLTEKLSHGLARKVTRV